MKKNSNIYNFFCVTQLEDEDGEFIGAWKSKTKNNIFRKYFHKHEEYISHKYQVYKI